MAGKQLGKLRQWAGEVISSRDKTTVSDEFKELEKDVELRRDGAQRLFAASEAYHKHMAKKKDNVALDDAEKLLPIDTLGIVMIIHGEEFGQDSPFGNSLVTLGRAHCNVAKLQETYAQSFHDSFIASLVRFADDIKDYEALKKKLESRRLSYDAATAKHEKLKNGKKEKERNDAQEEMQRAKARYEETAEELEAHMHAIQENEIVQLRELTGLLTLEINFVEQYLDVLRETRANWPSDSHSNSHPAKHSFPSQKFGSMRSKKSATRTSESSEDEEEARPSSRPSSRSASRASRKRSDSAGTAGGEKRRLSVAGWASSAVGSVTGRGKSKSKDKETFASLTDDPERDSGHGESDNGSGNGNGNGSSSVLASSLSSITRRASKSKGSNGSSKASGQTTPKLPARILKPPSQVQRKVVRALYDFSGSSDELAFKTGDQIVVVNEVLDGWWMGELNGKQGLFPTPYTEVIPDKPPLPKRAGRLDDNNHLGLELDSDDSRNIDNESDDDRDEHYGHPLAATSPFYGGPSDAASIASSVADDTDDEQNLMSSFGRAASSRPTPPRRSTTSELFGAQGGKKAPPPPPPPRRATNSATASPLIPDRRPPSRPSSSAGSLPRPGFASAASSESSHGNGRAKGGCRDFKQNPFKPQGMCRITLNSRKIVILGSRSVGKSSLVKQFVENNFADSYYPTIEETAKKNITYKGIDYPCEIIDTAGQDEFTQLNPQYAIGIHGYVLVYSVASHKSFQMIQVIYDKITSYCGVPDVPAVIVGSKADLFMSRQVDSTDGERLAAKNKAAWIEASALENQNVGQVFELCLAEIEKRNAPQLPEPRVNKGSGCFVM
ncbi:hypothetical protein C8R43DRAFT_1094216 [Mycena crocata]|nr:hypothetical protein C8R43DRAFT_1094216 [Mycena crocata]